MTIGVVITVFNLESFVEKAIMSVLKQSVKPHKIVIVNDGSTDHSLDVIRLYRDQCEIVNHDQNKGVLPSMITAIKALDSDIIAFLDGDDIWKSDKLAEILEVFNTHQDVMMVTHSYEWIDAYDKPLGTVDDTHKNLLQIREKANDLDTMDIFLKQSILSYRGVWLGSAFSIRREALSLADFETWSESMWGHHLSHQDQPLAAFLILQNPLLKIYYLHKVLFQYRVFQNNSSGSSDTIEKALKTLSRSRATIIRTFDIVCRMTGHNEAFQRQRNKLKEIDYLEALYKNNRWQALRLFIELLLKFWSSTQRIKELQRFVAVMLLGSSNFLRLKTKRKRVHQ